MGIGANSVALYYQLRRDGTFSNVHSVIEIGSEDMSCKGYEDLIAVCIAAFGKEATPEQISQIATGSGREFHEALGLTYTSVDTDGRHGAIPLDLNFDSVPENHCGRYDLVTNNGTTEHVINQLNAFTVVHDLTKKDGLMLHIFPYRRIVDHCFFNYHPDFVESLARYNGYEILGLWLMPNTVRAGLIPWHRDLISHLHLGDHVDSMLVTLMKKPHSHPFSVPYQQKYEKYQLMDNAARYSMVVDGEVLNGAVAKRIALSNKHSLGDASTIPFRQLVSMVGREFARRVNRKIGRG